MSTIYDIVNPATRLDLAECARPAPYVVWRVLQRQLKIGESRAVRVDGVAVAVLGLVPHGNEAECWFMAAPAAADHMLAIIRTMRLTLAGFDYDPVYTVVRSDAGHRISRLAGFVPDQKVNNLEIFRWAT
jgi:hypothetical protein